MEANHEKQMPKELFHVINPFCFHDGEVSSRNGRRSSGHRRGNHPDGTNGPGLGLAHLVEGLTDPQVVVPDTLSYALHQFMEVGTSRFGSVPRFVHCQEFIFNVILDGAVDSSIWQCPPPDHGGAAEDHVHFLKLSGIVVPPGNLGGCFDSVNQQSRGDAVLVGPDEEEGQIG